MSREIKARLCLCLKGWTMDYIPPLLYFHLFQSQLTRPSGTAKVFCVCLCRGWILHPFVFLILPSGWWEVQPPSSANLSDLAALQGSRRDVLLSISVPSFLLFSCPEAASGTMFPLCYSSLLSWQEPSRVSTGCDPSPAFLVIKQETCVTSLNQSSQQSASRCPGRQSPVVKY